MDLVELTGYEKRAPNQLSGGQQQRVALARALVMEPKVLLMDEPLSNLDAKLRESMRTEIRRIQRSLGITSVYVTHDQIEAMTLSDRVVVMNQGLIEQVGTPGRGVPHPTHPLCGRFHRAGELHRRSGGRQSQRRPAGESLRPGFEPVHGKRTLPGRLQADLDRPA